MITSNGVYVQVLYDAETEEEGYIFTSGREHLRLNQKTARWVLSWLSRNLTTPKNDNPLPPENNETEA